MRECRLSPGSPVQKNRRATLRRTTPNLPVGSPATVGAVALLVGILIAAVVIQDGRGTAEAGTAAYRVGSPAPDFTLRLFNGQTITLSSLKGKPVLVNFWHSG
ncbi:MAG: redoxin domain-containing protein [candidate division NC10 bacterium]|nr:redoxin domain-containing protein [candidate division NC10 bacterium]